MGIYSHCISPFIIFLNIKEASLSKVIPLLPNLLPSSFGYSFYTSQFNKKSFNKRVQYKQNLRVLITKNQ